MRDFVSCFSENAVHISHPSTTCSPAAVLSSLSMQTAVTSHYAAAHHPLTISVTWTKAPSVEINLAQSPDAAVSFKLDTTARFFKKNKGSKSYDLHSSKIDILWDLSAAIYSGGPEPISGFYVLITADSEICLVLGEIPVSLKLGFSLKQARLVSRTEHWSGNALFSTRAKFSERGADHEILIKCSAEDEEEEEGKKQQPGLRIWIDKKAVMRVKRLKWNFRGNESIFIDGLLVDLLWDVHDWFFGSAIHGFGVFMFRRRSVLETRLWLQQDKNTTPHNHIQNNFDFSLMIYASKSS